MTSGIITPQERACLRELARKQREYANLPVMEQRTREWIAHNRCQGTRPMVIVEAATFWPDVRPVLRCVSEPARWLEDQLLRNIFIHEQIGDDHVMPGHVHVRFEIEFTLFGLKQKKVYANDGLGYHIEPVIGDLSRDAENLGASVCTYDKHETRRRFDFAEEMVGDILPPLLKNDVNHWAFGITQQVVNLMGMENMFIAMMDAPEAFHRLMNRIVSEMAAFLRWQERYGLILPNHGNDYMGSGSYCFTDELPRKGLGGAVTGKDTWGHLNSQESVGISPGMYEEFIAPYYLDLSREFGLLYYGCCEPVDPFWEHGISRLCNLRKVSISPWCDESYMAERLAGSNIIYSRKPSPNLLGVQAELDEAAFRQSIKTTAGLTQKCKTEYIFRDVYALHGNVSKLNKAVELVRHLTA